MSSPCGSRRDCNDASLDRWRSWRTRRGSWEQNYTARVPVHSRHEVVILTSSREKREIVDSYRLGVNSYSTKPGDFEQFTEAVRTLGLYWVLLNQAPILTG